MQTSTYPCDEFISYNLFNLSLFEREPEVVPRDLVPLEAYITPDFATDNDINGMALDTGRDVEISTRGKDCEQREWDTFRLLVEDTIRRSDSLQWDSLPWYSSLSDEGSQTQMEIASLNCDFGGDEAPPKSLSRSPTLKKSSRRSSRRMTPTHGSAMLQAAVHERRQTPTNICPILGCEYRQVNGRMQELRRHIKTHLEFRCTDVLTEHGMWIGGCLKTFSSGEALERHMRNSHVCAHPRPSVSRIFYL